MSFFFSELFKTLVEIAYHLLSRVFGQERLPYLTEACPQGFISSLSVSIPMIYQAPQQGPNYLSGFAMPDQSGYATGAGAPIYTGGVFAASFIAPNKKEAERGVCVGLGILAEKFALVIPAGEGAPSAKIVSDRAVDGTFSLNIKSFYIIIVPFSHEFNRFFWNQTRAKLFL